MVENVSKSEQPFVVNIIKELASKYELDYMDIHYIVNSYFITVAKIMRELDWEHIDLEGYKGYSVCAVKLPKLCRFDISKNKLKNYKLMMQRVKAKREREKLINNEIQKSTSN